MSDSVKKTLIIAVSALIGLTLILWFTTGRNGTPSENVSTPGTTTAISKGSDRLITLYASTGQRFDAIEVYWGTSLPLNQTSLSKWDNAFSRNIQNAPPGAYTVGAQSSKEGYINCAIYVDGRAVKTNSSTDGVVACLYDFDGS